MPDPRLIKPVENYRRMPLDEVVYRGLAVADGMDGNPHFPKPPIAPADLRAAVVRLQALQAEGLDGSRKVIAERNRQLDEVIRMLRLLGRYVEITSDGDMEKFRSSRFEPAPSNPLVIPQLSENVWRLDHGPNSGEIVIRLKAIADAFSYELRYGPMSEKPETWTTKPITRVKTPITIRGLTPATMYGFQVRSLGKDGFSDWSNTVTLMCV